MPGDQSLAVVLPRSNSLGLFANNYYRTKQMKAQKAAQAQDAALKGQAAAMKIAADIDGGTSPLVKVQGMIGQTVIDGHKAAMKAAAEGKSLPEVQLIADQYSQKAKQLKSWGDEFATRLKEQKDFYNGINGLNGNAVESMIGNHFLQDGQVGVADLSPEAMQKVIEPQSDLLVTGNKASNDFFGKSIGIQKVSTKRNSNGLVTASGESWDVPNDAEVEGDGAATRVVPKSEVFVADGPGATQELQKGGDRAQIVAAQIGLSKLPGNKDGKIKLYDKPAYELLVKDEGVKRELNRDFNDYVAKYEAANPGYTFPKGGQLEETAKRAIAYQKRSQDLTGKYNQTIPQAQYHFSVNNGGSGKGAQGDVPLTQPYQQLQKAVEPVPDKAGFMFNPEVPVGKLEAITSDKIMTWARNKLPVETRALADGTNIIAQHANDGSDRVRVRYKPPTGRYVDLSYINELDLNPTAQPSVKGKNKSIAQANANQQKPPVKQTAPTPKKHTKTPFE